jgi:two-component system, chemotaxis family, chemotaxis protein CheY
MKKFAPIKHGKDGQPVCCLIVDDSIIARENLRRMIARFGGRVAAEATDGLTAIAEYDRTRPDIVLMDITMPRMDGIEAARKIVRQHPAARIVMVSAVGYLENIAEALLSGAKGFIEKPVKVEALYDVIQDVLGKDDAPGTIIELQELSCGRTRRFDGFVANSIMAALGESDV